MTIFTETANDDSTREAVLRKWLRLPSFGFCCSTALLVCIAYLGWIVIDAQYPMTLFVARYCVGLEQVEPDPLVGLWSIVCDDIRSWDGFGPRLVLFAILAIAVAVSSMLMILQFLRRTTIRRMMLSVLVMCVWLSLWASYAHLNEWAVLRRAKSALPRFEPAATSLSQHWPTEHGTLPEAGSFYAYPDKHPNLLLLNDRKGYPIREDFGYMIERSELGAMRFRLSSTTDHQIEFHPHGSKPASYSTTLGSTTMRLKKAIRLKEGWYLVRYGGP